MSSKTTDVHSEKKQEISTAMTAQSLSSVMQGESQKERTVIPIGTGQIYRDVAHVLQGNGDATDIVKRRKMVAHRDDAAIVEVNNQNKKSQRITFCGTDGTSYTSVTISQRSNLQKNSKKVWKISEFFRAKINEQLNFKTNPDDPKVLEKQYIEFDLEEMVENGMYSSTRAAWDAIRSVFPTIRAGFSIEAKVKVSIDGKYGYNELTSAEMFLHCRRDNNIVTVYVNPDPLFWKIVHPQITYIPPWYFRVTNHTQYLISLAAVLARNRSQQKQLMDHGSFSISFKTVWEALNLPYPKGLAPKGPDGKPTVNEVKNARRDVIEPVEKCIDEINKNENGPDAVGIRMEIGTKSGKFYLDERVSEFWADGIINVTYSGAYLDNITAFGRRKNAEQEKEKKISERARIAGKAAAEKERALKMKGGVKNDGKELD